MAQTQKIMLIEDSDDCREILATMIGLMGCEVIHTADTADLIVVYLDFPEMRTIKTIRSLRSDPTIKEIPIIVFLPWSYDAASLVAMDAGANEVFDGPLKIESLQAGIEKYAPRDRPPANEAGIVCPPSGLYQRCQKNGLNESAGLFSWSLSWSWLGNTSSREIDAPLSPCDIALARRTRGWKRR